MNETFVHRVWEVIWVFCELWYGIERKFSVVLNEEHALPPLAKLYFLSLKHCWLPTIVLHVSFPEDPFLKTAHREFKALGGNFHFQNLMGRTAFYIFLTRRRHKHSRVKEVNYSKESKAASVLHAKEQKIWMDCTNEHFIRHNQVSDISYKKEDFPFIFTKKSREARSIQLRTYKIQLTLYSSMICGAGGRGVSEERRVWQGLPGWQGCGWARRYGGVAWCKVGVGVLAPLFYQDNLVNPDAYLHRKTFWVFFQHWKKFFLEFYRGSRSCRKSERIWKMSLMSKNGCGLASVTIIQKGKGGNEDSLSKLRSEFHYGFKGVFLWKSELS